MALVVPGGPAFRPRQGNPLSIGDEILTVDGAPAQELYIVQQLRGSDVVGSSLHLRVMKCRNSGSAARVENVILIRQNLQTLNATHDLSMSIAQLLSMIESLDLKKDKITLKKQMLRQQIHKVQTQIADIEVLRVESNTCLRAYADYLQKLISLNQSMGMNELLIEFEKSDVDERALQALVLKVQEFTFQFDQLRECSDEKFRSYASELETALLTRFGNQQDAQAEKDDVEESENIILSNLLVRWSSMQYGLLDEEWNANVKARLKRMQKVIAHVIWGLAPEPKIAVWSRCSFLHTNSHVYTCIQ